MLLITTKYRKKFLKALVKLRLLQKGEDLDLQRECQNTLLINLIQGDGPILWVDTIYGNIKRYIEIYILPEIKKIKYFEKRLYEYNKTDARLIC